MSWLGWVGGRGVSGYAQHAHDVGMAGARAPACHHDHQVPHAEEATELSWQGCGEKMTVSH